jgi:plastocyanin
LDTQVAGSVSATAALPRWRSALVAAALGQIAFNVVSMVVNGAVVPPLIVLSGLLVVGLAVLRTNRQAGAVMLGAVSVFHLVGAGRFAVDAVVHPESFWDFWLAWSTTVAAVLATVAAVPVWRRDDDGGRRARVVWLAVAGLIVVAGVVGAVATMAYESEAAQAGDLMLVARDVEFEPADVSAEAGQVAVFVENADALRHTFTVDELDVDLEAPGGKAARVEFTAEPGTYEFYCAVEGHEAMRGELTID